MIDAHHSFFSNYPLQSIRQLARNFKSFSHTFFVKIYFYPCHCFNRHLKVKKLNSAFSLRFSKTCALRSSKAALKKAFFVRPSIKITITSNEPWNKETHKMDWNPQITSDSWPFEPVEVNFCFVRGLLRWLTAAKNANVTWLLNFRIGIIFENSSKIQNL